MQAGEGAPELLCRDSGVVTLAHLGEVLQHRQRDLLALGGRYRELYDRQHRYEENRFVNPGEDYAPGAVRKG